jgi:hypothetical protein
MALVVPGLLSPHANDTLDPVVSVAASANDADYTCTDVRRTLSSISPLEVQQTPDGRYFRPYRVEYLNTVKWENTNSNAVLVKSAPSETVQYLPVDLI